MPHINILLERAMKMSGGDVALDNVQIAGTTMTREKQLKTNAEENDSS